MTYEEDSPTTADIPVADPTDPQNSPSQAEVRHAAGQVLREALAALTDEDLSYAEKMRNIRAAHVAVLPILHMEVVSPHVDSERSRVATLLTSNLEKVQKTVQAEQDDKRKSESLALISPDNPIFNQILIWYFDLVQDVAVEILGERERKEFTRVFGEALKGYEGRLSKVLRKATPTNLDTLPNPFLKA